MTVAMTVAIWIIAACEIIRMLQNAVQLGMIKRDESQRQNAYEEFVKSLKQSDKEFVRRMLEEIEEQERGDE